MSSNDMLRRWTQIDKNALSELLKLTTSPGIHQMATTALPFQIQQMRGADSCFVTAYSSAVEIERNTFAWGELAVVRTDEGVSKAYNYAIASSGDGRAYFNGPYKDFRDHHFTSTSQVLLGNLFGHIPYDIKSTL